MIWLEDGDLKTGIKDAILARLIEEDNEIKWQADREATEEVQGYLRGRFNLQAIFSQKGIDRNQLLVMILRDVYLYHLHARINPNQIPDIRLERYKEAIEKLKAIRDGKMNIGLPTDILPNDQEPEFSVRYGSEPKRTY